MSGSARNLAVGAMAGYVASRTMDQATSWFYERQTEESKRREQEVAPGGTLVQLGKQVGQALGSELSEEDAGRVGLAIHRTLGISYGAIAAALIRRGTRPLKAGLAVGAAAFVLVDEGTAIAQVTDFPAESHLRGVIGHAAFGLAAGVLLSLVDDD